MKLRGFIFDLDGVIVDTAKYHFLSWRKIANSIGVDFTEQQNEQLKGISRAESLEKILNWANIQLSQDKFTELMTKKNNAYLQYVNKMDSSEILPDVNKILDYLKEKNIPIALGSASKNSKLILNKVNLNKVFDAIVDGNSVAKAKPDPEVFLQAAKEIDVLPKNCVVFEDSLAGVKAANSAGMISIGIGKKEVLFEADFVFENFTEISLDFINQLANQKTSMFNTKN